jgi:hypothetical protein
MTFEGQYLTYAEYTELGGSAIGEMPFNLLEFEARRQIDSRTQSRLKDSKNVPQEAKLCDNKLINSIMKYAENKLKAESNDIKSENTDGYSVSKITPDMIKDIVESHQSDIDDIIRTYLLGVIYNGEHLMYCGVI